MRFIARFAFLTVAVFDVEGCSAGRHGGDGSGGWKGWSQSNQVTLRLTGGIPLHSVGLA